MRNALPEPPDPAAAPVSPPAALPLCSRRIDCQKEFGVNSILYIYSASRAPVESPEIVSGRVPFTHYSASPRLHYPIGARARRNGDRPPARGVGGWLQTPGRHFLARRALRMRSQRNPRTTTQGRPYMTR